MARRKEGKDDKKSSSKKLDKSGESDQSLPEITGDHAEINETLVSLWLAIVEMGYCPQCLLGRISIRDSLSRNPSESTIYCLRCHYFLLGEDISDQPDTKPKPQ